MEPVILIGERQLNLIIKRLCFRLLEQHPEFESTVLLGLQPRGVLFAKRILEEINRIAPHLSVQFGSLDITFFRDDFRRRDKPIAASPTEVDFIIEGKRVILVDDVLYTGRTIRAGLDAMLAFGRPSSVELLVLIDRRFKRELPIEPNYVGRSVDSLNSQKVKVEWNEFDSNGRVLLFTQEDENV
jgi:pyrimidine operon attenuation protein / uracil phosphoribosyltransferase